MNERIDLLTKGAKASYKLRDKLAELESRTKTAIESVFYGSLGGV